MQLNSPVGGSNQSIRERVTAAGGTVIGAVLIALLTTSVAALEIPTETNYLFKAVVVIAVLVYLLAHRFTVAGLGKDISTSIGLKYNQVILIGTILVAIATGVVTVVEGAASVAQVTDALLARPRKAEGVHAEPSQA